MAKQMVAAKEAVARVGVRAEAETGEVMVAVAKVAARAAVETEAEVTAVARVEEVMVPPMRWS